MEHCPIQKLTPFAGTTGNNIKYSGVDNRHGEMQSQRREISYCFTIHTKCRFLRQYVPGYPYAVTEFSGRSNLVVGYSFIEAAKYGELALAVTDHRLVSTDTKRTSETQIPDGFQHAGFSTAIFTVKKIDGRREADRRRREVAEVFRLQFNERHRSR